MTFDASTSAGWIGGGSASSRPALAISTAPARNLATSSLVSPEWDLAVLAGRVDEAGEGRVAPAACASASGHPAPDPVRLAPFRRVRDLEAYPDRLSPLTGPAP